VRVETLLGVAVLAEKLLHSTPIQGKVIERIRGADLVGLRYTGPFDDLPAQDGVEHRVIPWDGVSMDEGTGIVHIAPGCGAEDFELGRRDGLSVLVPIDENGAFRPEYGWLHGHHTAEAAYTIIEELGQRGRLVQAGELTHRYPVCWRCGTELVWRVVDEWFIRCDEIREPMLEAARTVAWKPPQYGKRMEDWLRNMGDWCISRKRYWGLPLPFWFCDDGHMTIVGSKQELFERALGSTEHVVELHRPWIDEVLIPCAECAREARRTTDVGDCWLDAGIVPFSTMGWHNDSWRAGGYAEGAGVGLTGADLPDHASWQEWFPAAWVSEQREQIRLWFYSMLFMSVVLDGRAPYRSVLTYERLNDETGRPMHKSWGNMIEANEAFDTTGADVMRWMYAAQPPAQNLNFGYGPTNEVKRRLLTLWNSYWFLATYASIEGFIPRFEIAETGPNLEAAKPLDRWMLAATQRLVGECRAALDEFDSPHLVRLVERFFTDDLSNWYIRLSRARFYGSGDPADTRVAFETLWYSLVQLIRCVAPVMPFLSDEIWQNLVRGACAGAPASVHLSSYPEPLAPLEDPNLLRSMEDVRAVVELGRAARAGANLKVRQPLRAVLVASEDPRKREVLSAHARIIEQELNVKDVRILLDQYDFAQVEVIPNFRLLGPKYGKDIGRIQALLREGQFERADGKVKVGEWVLAPGEVEVRTRARKGFAVVEGRGFALALDTELTPELQLEGGTRDLIRRIQDLRKDAGMDLTDRIRITHSAAERACFEAHGDWIARETLAVANDPDGAELRIEKA
jgi:isoleucyl-tRNA synthetase